jgi:hypothetical protein
MFARGIICDRRELTTGKYGRSDQRERSRLCSVIGCKLFSPRLYYSIRESPIPLCDEMIRGFWWVWRAGRLVQSISLAQPHKPVGLGSGSGALGHLKRSASIVIANVFEESMTPSHVSPQCLQRTVTVELGVPDFIVTSSHSCFWELLILPTFFRKW